MKARSREKSYVYLGQRPGWDNMSKRQRKCPRKLEERVTAEASKEIRSMGALAPWKISVHGPNSLDGSITGNLWRRSPTFFEGAQFQSVHVLRFHGEDAVVPNWCFAPPRFSCLDMPAVLRNTGVNWAAWLPYAGLTTFARDILPCTYLSVDIWNGPCKGQADPLVPLLLLVPPEVTLQAMIILTGLCWPWSPTSVLLWLFAASFKFLDWLIFRLWR
jgi:hypothetical protein